MPGCWVDNAIRYRGVKSELSILMIQHNMLVPPPCQGTVNDIPIHIGYEWINSLPTNKKIFFSLFQCWPEHDLPPGYEFYIVSFHLEAVDLKWLKKQKVTDPIIVLHDGHSYDLQIDNVHFVQFFYWHFQLEKMLEWFGIKQKQSPTHKFSAVCNRISQSKVWVTTKLLETCAPDSLIVLNHLVEPHGVHDWALTGNHCLDHMTLTFKQKYLGKVIKIDNFENDQHNLQKFTGNPWQPLYQDCVVHFTNESFAYSLMHEDDVQIIWPGPFLTEKTFKCLLGATAFVPVGQFQTYHSLKQLGFCFDYDFDTLWDNDAGNLSRFERILKLIDRLSQHSVNDLVNMTAAINLHNQNHIVSGEFRRICNEHNQQSVAAIFDLL